MNIFQKALAEGIRQMPDEALIDLIRNKISAALDLEKQEPAKARPKHLKTPAPPKSSKRMRADGAKTASRRHDPILEGITGISGRVYDDYIIHGEHYLVWRAEDGAWHGQDKKTKRQKKKPVLKVTAASKHQVLDALAEKAGG